ncbi:MAG: STAS domain-containing protein [Actinobacteria bacterium]|nr:STAS domain-containing protein [Dehalococcoidia bacterium]MCB9011042.1 STAS domain-containing protein [Actinomycetota bacterium]
MSEEQVQVQVTERADGVLVTVTGVVDALSLADVSRELTDAQRGSRPVYVDLAGVTFMDSRGLGSLLAANERSREGAAPLRIYRPSEPVRRLLEVSGVAPVLTEVSDLPG